MGRRYRGDSAAQTVFWIVLSSPLWWLYAPYLIGKEAPWTGLCLAILPITALALFRKNPPADSWAAKAQQHQALVTVVLLGPIALFVWGAADGIRERATAARSAHESALREVAAERREALARTQAEAADRLRIEAAHRRAAAARSVEAQRTPEERVVQAAAILDEDTGSRDRVCRARSMLAPVGSNVPGLPGLREVRRRLRRLEAAVLSEDRSSTQASRMVRCCDGTRSPTCGCSGSHRGCCSRHGGVCGCDPLPTEVLCR